MKYNGLDDSYSHLHQDSFFCLWDVLTLSEIIRKNEQFIYLDTINKEYLLWVNKYYETLGNSILRWIHSKYKMSNYIDLDFKEEFLWSWVRSVLLWLFNIRSSYLSVINCFSSWQVWWPWRSTTKCINPDNIHNEIIWYEELSQNLETKIISTWDCIWNELWEDIEKYISLQDLKHKYWLNLNLDEINENYFKM